MGWDAGGSSVLDLFGFNPGFGRRSKECFRGVSWFRGMFPCSSSSSRLRPGFNDRPSFMSSGRVGVGGGVALDFGGRVISDLFGVTLDKSDRFAFVFGGSGGTNDATLLFDDERDMLDFGGRVALDLDVIGIGPFLSTVLLANRVGSFGSPTLPSLVAFAKASRGTPTPGPGI